MVASHQCESYHQLFYSCRLYCGDIRLGTNVQNRGGTGLEATLVPDNRVVSRCTICCNRICCDERLDQCSNNFDNRCRVSEILNNSLVRYNDSHSCLIIYDVLTWMGEVVNVILGAIMIIRLHVMYQQSRKVLIFLVVIFLAIRIASAVIVAIMTVQVSAEELLLSGTHQCMIDFAGDSIFLVSMTWILGTVWEALALCLAVWIAVKHFRELRRDSRTGPVRDCLTVLIQTHVIYFASFLAASCFQIGLFSSTLSIDIYSLDTQIYIGFAQIFEIAQLSVLGPRLILSVRENHAKLVADSDTTSAMTSIIVFQEGVHVETSSSV